MESDQLLDAIVQDAELLGFVLLTLPESDKALFVSFRCLETVLQICSNRIDGRPRSRGYDERAGHRIHR